MDCISLFSWYIWALSEPMRAGISVCTSCVCHTLSCAVCTLQVSSIASYMEPLTTGAIGTASKTMNSKRQMAILDQTKTVTESAMQMLMAAKEAGGNPKVGGA